MTEPTKLNHQYTCVVDRDTISLAALISSYQFVPGTYLPLFPPAFHTEIPTLKHRGWGTLATYSPMRYSSGILSSHAAVKRKQNQRLGHPSALKVRPLLFGAIPTA